MSGNDLKVGDKVVYIGDNLPHRLGEIYTIKKVGPNLTIEESHFTPANTSVRLATPLDLALK